MLPPLITERSHVRAVIAILEEVLSDLEANPPVENE